MCMDGWSVSMQVGGAARGWIFQRRHGLVKQVTKVTFGSFSFPRRIPKPEGITDDASFSSISSVCSRHYLIPTYEHRGNHYSVYVHAHSIPLPLHCLPPLLPQRHVPPANNMLIVTYLFCSCQRRANLSTCTHAIHIYVGYQTNIFTLLVTHLTVLVR